MAVQYSETEKLLRSRAVLNTRLNLMIYDVTPEIKERGDGKYLYVGKRVSGNIHLKRKIFINEHRSPALHSKGAGLRL